MIRVFIGFDTVETVSYHVLSHSIQARCSEPVSITPLMLTQLSSLMTRERHNLQSTEFSFSRDDNFAVQVVKHDHVPKETTKFLGKPQSKYEKKNWSSVMLFNNEMCKALTPDFVNTATGLELHRYQWLDGDHLIGDIPHRWNHLGGYDETVPAGEVSNLHYTIGGPYFDDYKDTDYAAEWFAEKDAMLRCDQKK